MDFFASQDAARTRTRRLAFLFLLAVALIVLSVYATVTVLFAWSGLESSEAVGEDLSVLWDPARFFVVAVAVVGLITLGSVFKTLSLRQGGSAVATMLGGRRVPRMTTDADERRLLNVVEEMALASGVAVPEVYVMDQEEGINAFAAGFSPQEAVIGVTRGCVQRLKRDELQGVIAHEFSHILNGDMRMNLRLIGILHGILLIALVGRVLMRVMFHSRGGSSNRRNKGGGQIALLGLALFLIGYIGLFFGRLIKAGISRQREYLADASAVQFTRDPTGIAGALKKIGGLSQGSSISNPGAEQASHMFFGASSRPWFAFLLSTHPPLEERIRRLDPMFAGFAGTGGAAAAPPPRDQGAAGAIGFASGGEAAAAAEGSGMITPEATVERAGRLDPPHIEYAHSLLASLPEELHEAAREPTEAQSLLYAMLLHPDEERRRVQVRRLQERAPGFLLERTLTLAEGLKGAAPQTRLPLLDLALPSLKSLSEGQFDEFFQNVRALITADGSMGLFEYVVQSALVRHLREAGRRARREGGRVKLRAVSHESGVLLSVLAWGGTRNPAKAGEAFEEARRQLGRVGRGLKLLEARDARLRHLDAALDTLVLLDGRGRRDLLRACAVCVMHDHKITIAEGELLRAVADGIGVPLPPFIPGQEI